MTLKLFDDFMRTESRAKRRREPSFAFLNRSSRAEYDLIRDLLETWFAEIPSDHKSELRSRFRSKDAGAHTGAQFELMLHELMRQLGMTIEIHPQSIRTTRPDFSVAGEGGRFYLEATDVNPRTSLFADHPLEDAVFDAIDDLDSPDFFLSIETSGALTSAPPHRRVVRPLADFMAAHSPDNVAAAIEAHGHEASPRITLTHEGWNLTARLIPKSQGRRGNAADRAIGIGPMKGGFTDSATPLRRAILAKAGRYGTLNDPLVVAANAHDVDDRIDEMEALFGKERFTYRIDRLDDEPEFDREPNGVWVQGGAQPRYTRLHAVLLFRNLAPWTLHSHTNVCLYVNPFTTVELPPALQRLPHATAVDGRMQWFDGESVGDILGVPSSYLDPPR